MAYIFVDESGDLGFNPKKRNTNHFLISFLFVSTGKKRRIEKIVKKTFLTLKKSKKKKSGILHAYKETPVTRHRLLKLLEVEDVKIMTICLNKKRVYTNLREEKNVLYNYVVNILLDRIYTRKLLSSKEKIFLIASRKDTNKFLNENFKNYLENDVSSHKLKIEVKIETPQKEKCLQAIDFVCWAIFRKYEKNDYDYYNVIKEKIVEESWLFGD